MMAVWSEVNSPKLAEGIRLDPEFYQPEYLKRECELHHLTCETLSNLAYITDGEHGSVEFTESGVKFLTAENIKDGYVEESNIRYVNYDVHRRNTRAAVHIGDVLISIKGTLGLVAVAEDWLPECNMNRDVAIVKIRDSKIASEYLAAFLLSTYGQFQLLRERSGGVQQMITLGRLRELRIPILNQDVQQLIKNRYQDAKKQRDLACSLYTQAEKMLLLELGLQHLDLSPTLFYEHSFFETTKAVRLDAEFYHPKSYSLIKAIRQTGKGRLLGEIVIYCERGIQPQYDDEGDIAVVNSKHMGKQFLSDDFECCSLESWEKQKKARLKQHDVLCYSTGAYIGRTNCWFGNESEKAIASNHVTIVRPNSECNPLYLALFMNSRVGLMQADRHAHGSAQREVYPNDLRAYTVWLPSIKKQEQLAEMVFNAKAARDESHHQLNEAKVIVEKTILAGK
jgi:hypothetical protein